LARIIELRVVRTEGLLRSIRGRWVAAVVAVVLIGGGLVLFAESRGGHYEYQYPDRKVDMSLDDALKGQGVTMPAGVSGVRYYARRYAEGDVLGMDFLMPCGEVSSFVESNGLSVLRSGEALSSAAVLLDAESLGWRQKADDVMAERPDGSSAGMLSALVSHEAGRCHVYVKAAN
jgi:hypothetical protein